MVSMSNPQSASQASGYLAQENYHQKNREIGRWRGSEKALSVLGLKQGQEIEPKAFKKVLEGFHPETGEKVSDQAGREDRRAGFDITMSSPKSVSILMELADAKGDKKVSNLLRTAHEKATQYAMNKLLENGYAKTRIMDYEKTKEAGKKIIELVNAETMWGTFEHDTSRRTEAGNIDPQLHSHNFVMSMVFREDIKTGKMKSYQLTNEEIYRQKMFLGQIYRNELASILQEEGLPIKVSDAKQGLFDLDLFTDSQMEAFSGRRADLVKAVEQELEKEWVDVGHHGRGAELYNKVNAKTKTEKEKVDRNELLIINEKRLEKEGIGEDLLRKVNSRILHREIHKLGKAKNLTTEDRKKIDALRKDHVAKAINLIEETKSVFSYEEIMRDTLKLGLEHGYKENDYKQAILENIAESRLIKLADNVYSTTRMVEAEMGMIDHIHNTKDSQIPFSSIDEMNHFIEKKDIDFKEGQDTMMQLILTTKDQFVAIQGDAGTGKSWVVDQIRMFIEERNSDVEMVGLSYTGQAVENLEKASKVKSSTIHSFLLAERTKQEDAPTKPRLIIVDETGMAGSLQIKDIMDAAIRNGDRVVFLGDTKQFQSIAAGQAFLDMQKYGIAYAEITKAVRQTTKHAIDTVEAIKDKDYERALSVLNSQKAYKEVSEDEAISMLSANYAGKYKKMDPLKDELILTSKNQTRTIINNKIHDTLFQDKAQQQFTIRDAISINGITRHYTHDIKNMMNGESKIILIPSKKIDGLQNGGSYKLSRIIDDKKIEIQTGGGKKIEINWYDLATEFNIYAEKEKSFAVGETIAFTKNYKKDPYTTIIGKGKYAKKEQHYKTEYKNGERDVVKEINGKMITLQSGKTIDTEKYNYFDYGYAITDVKSQGATVKNVSIFADPQMANFNSIYTQVTRAKENITLYTTNKEALEASLERDRKSESTLNHTMKRINGEYRKRHQKVSETVAKKEYLKPLTYSGRKFEATTKILEKEIEKTKQPVKVELTVVALIREELIRRLDAITAKVKAITATLEIKRTAVKAPKVPSKQEVKVPPKVPKVQTAEAKTPVQKPKENKPEITIPSILNDEENEQQLTVERQHTI